MIELNEYEYEMLDALLEAFGIPDSLTRDHVLELFDGDEASAFAMVQVLIREELIAATGKHGPYDLPERLVLKPKGEKFLKEGGFIRRHRLEQEKPVEIGGTLAKLQQQNMRLQQAKLANEGEVRDLLKRISSLQKRQYLWWILIVLSLVIGLLIGHAFITVKISKPQHHAAR